MAFDYPPASRGTSKGNGFYRINIPALTQTPGVAQVQPGTLIPIDVGFHAIAVGPDSDFQKYELFYPDPLAPGGVQQIIITPDEPFIGLVSPNVTEDYPGAAGVGTVPLIRPADAALISADFLNGSIDVPKMDIIVYTGGAPFQMPKGRSPKRLQNRVPVGPSFIGPTKNGHSIAAYGRKNFQCLLSNGHLITSVDITIVGVSSSYPIGFDIFAKKTESTVLSAVTAVAAGASFSFSHDSLVSGFYDYYLVLLDAASDILPSDSPSLQSVLLSMEVSD